MLCRRDLYAPRGWIEAGRSPPRFYPAALTVSPHYTLLPQNLAGASKRPEKPLARRHGRPWSQGLHRVRCGRQRNPEPVAPERPARAFPPGSQPALAGSALRVLSGMGNPKTVAHGSSARVQPPRMLPGPSGTVLGPLSGIMPGGLVAKSQVTSKPGCDVFVFWPSLALALLRRKPALLALCPQAMDAVVVGSNCPGNSIPATIAIRDLQRPQIPLCCVRVHPSPFRLRHQPGI